MSYITKKKLGDYSINELINICVSQQGHCENCPEALKSMCNKINFYELSKYYNNELNTFIETSIDNKNKINIKEV